MPRDRLVQQRPCKAHRSVTAMVALDVDAGIAASLRAAENEGWPPIRPLHAQRRLRTAAQASADGLVSEAKADAAAQGGRK